LAKRLKDHLTEGLRNTGARILYQDKDALVYRERPDPDVGALRGVLNGVYEQVLHDAFHLVAIDIGDERALIHSDIRRPKAIELGHDPADQAGDLGGLSVWPHQPTQQALEIKEVGEQPL